MIAPLLVAAVPGGCTRGEAAGWLAALPGGAASLDAYDGAADFCCPVSGKGPRRTVVLAVHVERSSEGAGSSARRYRHQQQEVVLYADVVEVGSPLRLPQTTVTILARRLVFRNGGAMDTIPAALPDPAAELAVVSEAGRAERSCCAFARLHAKAQRDPQGHLKLADRRTKPPAAPGWRGAGGSGITAGRCSGSSIAVGTRLPHCRLVPGEACAPPSTWVEGGRGGPGGLQHGGSAPPT